MIHELYETIDLGKELNTLDFVKEIITYSLMYSLYLNKYMRLQGFPVSDRNIIMQGFFQSIYEGRKLNKSILMLEYLGVDLSEKLSYMIGYKNRFVHFTFQELINHIDRVNTSARIPNENKKKK